MTARRIPDPSPDGVRGPLVTFSFDGRAYEGVEGEPLAAALLAVDRPILSRSFRFHRPRGLMCSTGQCGWCECEVDGRPSVRSCRVPVRAGLVACGEHAFPSVERDLLAGVGLVSRWIPPTFYHHRFLRPRRLRKRYLDVLRWFGGRGRLTIGDGRSAELVRRSVRREETDVLVVGGGRAGLWAALGAAEMGARVVLLEADDVEGRGWRSERGMGHATGRVQELAATAAAAGVQLRTGTVAIGWYDGTVAAVAADAHVEIGAPAIVAATGSYERVPFVPGADRPGVMSARTAASLIERYGILPGERAYLVGGGQELGTAGELLAKAGAQVLGPVRTRDLVAIRGRDRVTGVDIRFGGRRNQVAVDLVVFGDRSPNLDLVLAAGAAVERRGNTLVPVCDASGRTSIPSLFVVGSAAGWPLLDRANAEAARATGRSAAGRAGPTIDASPTNRPAKPGFDKAHTPAAIARNAMVCFCEDVRAWEIRAEQAAGYTDSELIKRRTGALTGPCQGKYCIQSFACLLGDPTIPTARPPLRPVRLGDLIAAETEPDASDGET